MHGGMPWMAGFDNPFLRAAGRAIEKGFGKAPVFNREGGSIPVVATFQQELGVPSVLFGVGLPDENAHAPNEKLDLGNFHGGIISSAYLYQEIAQLQGMSRRWCRRRSRDWSGLRPLPQPPSDPFALYVWEVIEPSHDEDTRRDAAMNALRRIPALTPDTLGRAPRAKLEKAAAHAGPYRDERIRALTAGADVFRRNRDLLSASAPTGRAPTTR